MESLAAWTTLPEMLEFGFHSLLIFVYKVSFAKELKAASDTTFSSL